MKTPYTPQPIDTSRITLTPEILALTERLAENNHDMWAKRRMAEGWKYGKQRDDVRKLHPCLVPYIELPESEKEYDRETALAAIRFLIASGYQIVLGER